jgi:hypothetical protein
MRDREPRAAGGRQRRDAWVVVAIVCLALVAALPCWAQSPGDLPELRPIRTELPPTFWEQHGFSLGLYAVEIVAFVAFLIWLFTRPVAPVALPIAVQVRAELGQLRRQPGDALVLSKVSQCLRRYFAGAFQLPSGELTTAEFSRVLAVREEIGARLVEQTITFLQHCDAVKFSTSAEMNPAHAVSEALDIVAQGEARREELRRTQAATVVTT